MAIAGVFDINFPLFFPLFDVFAGLKPTVPDWGAQDRWPGAATEMSCIRKDV